MKVKALVKLAVKSKRYEIAEFYNNEDSTLTSGSCDIIFVYVDGCFTPYTKAREDKRKVDNYYFSTNPINPIKADSEGRYHVHYALHINTVYVKEFEAHAISDQVKEKKESKKKLKKEEERCRKLEKKLMKTKQKMIIKANH